MATGDISIEVVFQQAAECMRNNRKLKLPTEQKLNLYGLFKQASEGPCTISKPGIFDMSGRAKWDAWSKLGTMSTEQAMKKYVELVNKLDPQWQKIPPPSDDVRKTDEGRGGVGPVVSTLMNSVEDIPDEEKNIFDWCKDGQVAKVAAVVTRNNVNTLDEEGMSLLHWACDRGHLEVAHLLVEEGADINRQDCDLQTPLHYATSCGHIDMVKFLLLVPGVDKNLCDCDGGRPIEVTSDPTIRTLLDTIM